MIQSNTLPIQNSTSQALETIPQDLGHPDDNENLSGQGQTLHDQNQILQQSPPEKHEETKEITQEKHIHFLTSPDSKSFKKLNRLSRPNCSAADACLIPERNLLLVLLDNLRMINIYNTISFNLVKVKESQERLICFSYSEHLQKILVGGEKSFLQTWNSKNFKVEKTSPEKGARMFLSLKYIAKSKVIAIKTQTEICVYNTELENITNLQLPRYDTDWNSATDFHGVTQELFLVICSFQKQKRLYLINLSAKTLKECREFFVPPTSCVKLTENNPTNIFSCLVAHQSKAFRALNEWDLFALGQFSINPETKQFVVCRTTLTNHLFSKLKNLKNSQYFFAEKNSEIFILSICKEQVEVLHVISKLPAITFEKHDRYLMIKGQSTVLKIDVKKIISIYSLSCMRQKLKDTEHQVPF